MNNLDLVPGRNIYPIYYPEIVTREEKRPQSMSVVMPEDPVPIPPSCIYRIPPWYRGIISYDHQEPMSDIDE